MSQPRVNFQVRRRDSASLAEMGRRAGLALGCTFTPSQAKEFEGDEVLESYLLGLWITLTVQLLDATAGMCQALKSCSPTQD